MYTNIIVRLINDFLTNLQTLQEPLTNDYGQVAEIFGSTIDPGKYVLVKDLIRLFGPKSHFKMIENKVILFISMVKTVYSSCDELISTASFWYWW